jgi:hypothetical protein
MRSSLSSPSELAIAAARMAEVSRALANSHHDRAFVLLCETSTPAIAAAFMLEQGVTVDELPRAAKRAIVDWKRERELAA